MVDEPKAFDPELDPVKHFNPHTVYTETAFLFPQLIEEARFYLKYAQLGRQVHFKVPENPVIEDLLPENFPIASIQAATAQCKTMVELVAKLKALEDLTWRDSLALAEKIQSLVPPARRVLDRVLGEIFTMGYVEGIDVIQTSELRRLKEIERLYAAVPQSAKPAAPKKAPAKKAATKKKAPAKKAATRRTKKK